MKYVICNDQNQNLLSCSNHIGMTRHTIISMLYYTDTKMIFVVFMTDALYQCMRRPNATHFQRVISPIISVTVIDEEPSNLSQPVVLNLFSVSWISV